MFRVHVPFGPFETGAEVTAADVLAAVPGADLDRLVRLESLVPFPGVEVGVQPHTPERAEEVIGDLHARSLSHEERADRLYDALAECRGHLTTLAKGTMNLQVILPAEGLTPGTVVAPVDVADRLADLLNKGVVGWTEKPAGWTPPATEASPAPGEADPDATVEVVTTPPADKPAKKKGK